MSKPTSGKPGFVYIFMNPLFPNWVKIGKAKNWSTRLKNYQQYVPEDYEPVATLKTSNMDKVEKLIHGLLEVCEERRQKEFFCIDADTAINVLLNVARTIDEVGGLKLYADGQVSVAYGLEGEPHPIQTDKTHGVKFHSSIKGSEVYMTVRDGEFFVLKGSKLRSMTDSLRTSEVQSIASIRRDRVELENDPTRCKNGKLLVNVSFRSSSRALAVMLGCSAVQGPKYWEDDEGRPLSDYLV